MPCNITNTSGNDYSIDQRVHFTYKKEMDKDTLCQGDIIQINDELKETLKNIHPYFLKEQYKYFIVLSQSCDLVRRKGNKCKTPYITLAAVKRFDDFIQRTAIQKKLAEKVGELYLMDKKKENQLFQLIERIYNNTEPEYFFLYKEDVLNFPESMVAYLKISFALKSDEHYEKCLRAKILELSDEFKAKLGWLIGDMYSRVGTTDWESLYTAQQKKDKIRDEINSRFVVGTQEQIVEVKNRLKDKDMGLDEAVELISSIKILNKYEQVLDVLEQIIRETKGIEEKDQELLMKKIKSRSKLKTLMR